MYSVRGKANERTTEYIGVETKEGECIFPISWSVQCNFIRYSALLHLPPLRFHCADGCWDRTQDRCNLFLQVLRAFGIPQRKHLYFISVSGAFLGTSLPPTPNWSRFDLFIDVYSIFTVFFTLFIVFLATHCICIFFFYLPFLSLRVEL